jgi:hypothetical protein
MSSQLLLLTDVLEADDVRLCRIAGWRLMVRRSGRISMSSAGWMWISGMTESEILELARLRDCEDVLRREGNRAWTICMVRTADMVDDMIL